MKVTIGCDHGAYELKEEMVKYLSAKGIECKDVGTYSKDSVHYPVYAKAVCEDVKQKNCDYGILLCSTGIGMSMAANKYKGIRAALCGDTYSAKFTRLHNNANVLCMGARVIGSCLAIDILDSFLENEFEGGRHALRVDMMMDIENR